MMNNVILWEWTSWYRREMNRDTDRQTDRQTNRLTDDKKTSAKANSILQVHVYAGMGSSTKFSASSISTIRCASTLFSITQMLQAPQYKRILITKNYRKQSSGDGSSKTGFFCHFYKWITKLIITSVHSESTCIKSNDINISSFIVKIIYRKSMKIPDLTFCWHLFDALKTVNNTHQQTGHLEQCKQCCHSTYGLLRCVVWCKVPNKHNKRLSARENLNTLLSA